MRPSRISSAVLAGSLGALFAIGFFDGPLGLVSAAQYLTPAISTPASTIIDRSLKGDRLRPDAGTTIILRNDSTGAPALRAKANESVDPKFVPTSLEECEPVASPYADPKLGKFAAKCFV